MAFERFKRTLGISGQGTTNPLAGQDSAFLARELENFSARQGATLVEQAEEAGFQEGVSAGQEGELPNERAFSARQKARNRGILVSHQAALQTDIRDKVAQFHVEHDADPDMFQARVDGMLEGALKEAPAELHPFIRQRAADYAGSAMVKIVQTQRAQLEAQAIADLQKGAQGLVQDATTAAFEGDVPMVEARRQEVEGLLQEAIKGELMDEDAADEFLAGFERQVIGQEVVGNLDRIVREQGIDAADDAIGRWQATKPSGLGLSREEHEAVTREMMTLRNRQRSLLADDKARQNAAQDAENRRRTDRVKDAIKVRQAGYSTPEEDTESLMADLAALDDPDLAAKFDIAQAIQSQVHDFRRTPELQREQALQELEATLRTEGATAELLTLQTSLERTHTEVSSAVDKDPRGFLNREGLIQDAQLDFSSAQGLVDSIAAREEVGRQSRSLVGREVPLLDASEADLFAQMYNAAEIGERVNMLGIITAGAGEQAEATIQQLDSKGYTQMALVGEFVVTGQRQLATDIVTGQALLAADQVQAPKALEYSGVIQDVMGSAYIDAPDRREDYIEAAIAKYAQLQAASGDLSPLFDRRTFRDAVQQVVPTADFNGWQVGIPADISERAFRDWTKSWTPETFEGLPGDPEQLLEDIRDRGRLTEVGNGRYGILMDSALTGRDRVLKDTEGRAFILEVPRER